MTKRILTVEEVITELGGPESVKELTHRASPSVVPTWKWRKRFPTKTYAVMQTALRERGLTAPDNLWGMP